MADAVNYAELNPLIQESIYGFANASARAARAQRRVMTYDPRNTPSRSQFLQGYTQPYQVFATSNTWQVASGQVSVGRRATQPSIKLAGPGIITIPTLPPWGSITG